MSPSAATAAPPALFLSHGSPMIAIEPREAGLFMQRLGPRIDAIFGRPRGIVALSPHTLTRTPQVLGARSHEAIHDFGGFPDALYKLRYNAPGEPALAQDIARCLQQAGIESHWSEQGGLDHGIWTALMHLYPQADVPVVPLSFSPKASPRHMFDMGKALSGLRASGVLIVASGSLTHNLQRFFTRPTPVDAPEEPDCAEFRHWVQLHAEGAQWPELLDYRRLAPHAQAMHPTDEHWLPFYFAAGAGAGIHDGGTGESCPLWPPEALRLHGSVTHGHLAMDAYGFGKDVSQLQDPPLA